MTIELTDEKTEKGVTERRFRLPGAFSDIPGIVWTPEGATSPRPTVLIGHGGTQHKRVPNVLSLARRLVRHLGYAAVAIDAPGHGARITDAAEAEAIARDLQARIEQGGPGQPVAMSAENATKWAGRTRGGRRDWVTTLDAITEIDAIGDGPFGYWGVSMGTAIGLPFVASEPRIRCAVLGLAGLPEQPDAAEKARALAASVRIPVLFVFQWDDELMTRQSGLDMFDALGTEDKTMHINPGGHVFTPLFERDSYDRFFERHLGRGA